jgi:hypothetical protein
MICGERGVTTATNNQFRKADAAIDRAAGAIARRIEQLFDLPNELPAVSYDYVVEVLLRSLLRDHNLASLLDRHMQAVHKPAWLKLSDALQDYRDAHISERR